MGIGAKIITEMTEELATFLSNFANKSSASVMAPSESYGVLKDLPYHHALHDQYLALVFGPGLSQL